MTARLGRPLAIVCFGVVFYANNVNNFFVWNDWPLIVENFLVKDWRHLPEILTSAFWKPLTAEPLQSYRPLVFITFAVDFSLWGLQPIGYHLTNTALHIVNSLLVYRLLGFYLRPTAAWLGALVFVTHPVHVEAVTYISNRAELLAALLALAGIVLFLEAARRGSKTIHILSLPCFFLAFAARESAVFILLWLLAADGVLFGFGSAGGWPARFARYLPVLGVVALWFMLRSVFVGTGVVGVAAEESQWISPVLRTLNAIPLSVSLLVFPVKLQFGHFLTATTDVRNLLAAFLLLAAAGWGLQKARQDKTRGLAFSLSWLFVGLSPVIAAASSGSPLLESGLYLPSMGACAFLGYGLEWVENRGGSRLHIWIGLLIAVIFGASTFHRNRDWKDDLQISLVTWRSAANDPLALQLLANAQFRRGRTDEAEALFQKAIALKPGDPRLHEGLGRLYSFLRKDDSALVHYQRMDAFSPGDPYPDWRLGRFHARRGNFPEAERHFIEARKLFPYSSEIRNELARAYYLQGKMKEAEVELETALKIWPSSPALQFNLEQIRRGR
jgi:tetratricopeptide (TPR) repeat protein